MPPSNVQQLVETVAAYVSGTVEARALSTAMDALTPSDLGIELCRTPFASLLSGGAITTQCVYACAHFEVVAFLFPARASLPLHDHPGMSVFSRVLHGALQMRSFSWAAAPPPNAGELDRWARELPPSRRCYCSL